MELLLDESAGGPEPGAARRVRPGDEQGLAQLMLAAHQGTADDEGEGLEEALEEVQHTLSGEYGNFLREHTSLIEEGGEVLSASLVTSFDGALLAFSMTHRSHKRRGLAGALVLESARSLRED